MSDKQSDKTVKVEAENASAFTASTQPVGKAVNEKADSVADKEKSEPAPADEDTVPSANNSMTNIASETKPTQINNPLHGVKLQTIVEELEAEYGWDGLAYRININCFKSDASVKSSLKFLRRTPWAREKVERLFLKTFHKKYRPESY